MDLTNIRKRMAGVVLEALDRVASNTLEGYNPASMIETSMPDFYSQRFKREYEEITAVYYLVDSWVDAKANGFEVLGDGIHDITVGSAKEILINSVDAFKLDKSLTDIRAIEWYRKSIKPHKAKGCAASVRVVLILFILSFWLIQKLV